VKVTVGGTTYSGRAVDLRARAVEGRAVEAAVRGERCVPAVDAPAPPPVYGYCGRVHPGMGLRTQTALAAAARSCGRETAHDDRIEELREQLAEREPAAPSLPAAREPVADGTVAELRETAAVERGRLQARKRLDADTAAVETAVRETTRTLAERETEQVAAEESRRQRRERAREYRDELERKRRLADQLANRRREARAALVDAVTDEFERALTAVPGPTPAEPFEASPVTAALAVLRVAGTAAPVVLEVDRFGTPAAAADWLGAPVVRC